jgi:hypothetical protein
MNGMIMIGVYLLLFIEKSREDFKGYDRRHGQSEPNFVDSFSDRKIDSINFHFLKIMSGLVGLSAVQGTRR